MSARHRRRFDDELDDEFAHRPTARTAAHPTDDLDQVANVHDDGPNYNNWADSTHGPEPLPDWVITSSSAVDEDLGVVKTGKEAEVSLVRRSLGDASVLMAAKRYRSAEHRLFHRDAGYLEGRRVRKSREMRAMRTRTAFGKSMIANQWAVAEFRVLSLLWSAGAPVPYPVQFDGDQLMMEFVGTADGIAAPRLAELRPPVAEASELYHQMRSALVLLADAGYTHGDLSAYNTLVHDGRVVLIDLPQAVDLVGNPQGFEYLRRDCENICAWFSARGVNADAASLDELLRSRLPG